MKIDNLDILKTIANEMINIAETEGLDEYLNSKAINFMYQRMQDLQSAAETILEIQAIKNSTFNAKTYDNERKSQRDSIARNLEALKPWLKP